MLEYLLPKKQQHREDTNYNEDVGFWSTAEKNKLVKGKTYRTNNEHRENINTLRIHACSI